MAASYKHRVAAMVSVGAGLYVTASFYFTILAFAVIVFCSVPAAAQTRQFAYIANGPNVVGYVLDPVTGSLTAVPGPPATSRAGLPIDMVFHPSGKFLYTLSGSNSVSAFRIDQTSGALNELVSSPYSAGGLSTPKGIAADKTGRYVLVAGSSLDDTSGTISTYAVNQITGELAPTGTPFPLQISPVGFGGSFVLNTFYYYGNYQPIPGSLLAAGGGVAIDPLTGALTTASGFSAVGSVARVMAISPKGNYLFSAHGQLVGSIDMSVLSGPGVSANSSLGAGLFASRMVVDAEEKYLYALINRNPLIHGYSIDPTTGKLTELPFSPFIGIEGEFLTTSADPSGPFLYVSTSGGLRGYRIGSNGSLTAIPGAPVPAGSNMVIGRVPGQPVTGPVPALSTSLLSFGQINVGSSSSPQQIALGNIGDRVLSIANIAIEPASLDFSQTNACPANLPPAGRCSITVTFTPSSQGAKLATLSVTSNGPPQVASLSGSGFVPPPPTPTVTLDRSTVDFPGATLGSTSQGQPVKVTNTGQAPLVFSTISVTGPNLNDFTLQSNTCTAPLPINGNCTLTAVFKPLGVGFRSAALQIVDNAPGSPHTVFLRGNGDSPPFTVGPAAAGSTTSTVAAGQAAQYSLQLAPKPDSVAPVTIALSCTGAPVGATCVVPPTVTSVNGVAAPFIVTLTTTARALTVPPVKLPFSTGLGDSLRILSVLLSAAALLFIAILIVEKTLPLAAGLPRRTWSYATFAVIMSAMLTIVACGGGSYNSSTPPPAPVSVSVTPATATVTVGQSVPFTATVQNDSTYNRGVTWSLSGSGCAAAGACGVVSSMTASPVTYKAPANPPTPATVTLTATSVSDPTKSGAATITVVAATTGTPLGTFTIMLTATSAGTTQQLPLTLVVR